MFGTEIWKEIDALFWQDMPCLPRGVTTDGINPVTVETNKRGVEIFGTIWLLPTGKYDFCLCLSRPGFSSIESVSVSKLRRAVIRDSCLEGQVLTVVVTDVPVGRAEMPIS